MNLNNIIYFANDLPMSILHGGFYLLTLLLISTILLKSKVEKKLRLSHKKFFELYESNGDALMLLNEKGFFECNKTTLMMFGCATREEFCSKHPADISPREQPCSTPSLILANQHIAFAIDNGCHRFEWVHQRIDNGQTFHAEVTLNTIKLDGKIVLRALVRDITERKQIEAELKLAAIIFESQEGMLVTDGDNIILRVNHSFTHLTGYSKEEVIGKTPNILKSGRHNNDFYAAMWNDINTTGCWAGEIWNCRKYGQIYPEYLVITAVKNTRGNVVNYVATFNDITLSKAAADRIERLAFYDPLTDLPNRRLLQDRLVPALASSHRSGQRGALLFIDMDNFKTLNDTLGHDMGDLLLQQISLRLRSTVRECDTVARMGGDEFVVLLEDLGSEITEVVAQAEMIGKKIITFLNQNYQLDTHQYHSTPSIGVTLFNGHEQTIEELLKQSDIAMYQAKELGRNRLCFFNQQMQTNITDRVALEADLHVALAENQFTLYYQPQITHDQQIIGAETLIRWQHPQRGLVSPVDFIPLAEETDLIVSIGQWVLETACTQLKIWEDHANTQYLQLSVNISAKQFHQTDFVEQVHLIVCRNAINPSRLKLELTETMALNNIEDTLTKLKALGKTGILFSMDDFGTGYSSLSVLKKLPFDQLKIDQSFVRDILIDPEDAVIAKTIIVMAANLGVDVIAEGVETEAQRTFLEQNGCSTYQGHLFSEPVPIEQFESLLMSSPQAVQPI